MADLTLVAYCGSHCGLCTHRGQLRESARKFCESLRPERTDSPHAAIPGEFWSLLCSLAAGENQCACRKGSCGPPLCGIRRCAQRRGVDLCPYCDEYPCERIIECCKASPLLLACGMRIKAIGVEAWIKEQER